MYVWAAVVTSGVLMLTKKAWVAIVVGVMSCVVLRRLSGA